MLICHLLLALRATSCSRDRTDGSSALSPPILKRVFLTFHLQISDEFIVCLPISGIHILSSVFQIQSKFNGAQSLPLRSAPSAARCLHGFTGNVVQLHVLHLHQAFPSMAPMQPLDVFIHFVKTDCIADRAFKPAGQMNSSPQVSLNPARIWC